MIYILVSHRERLHCSAQILNEKSRLLQEEIELNDAPAIVRYYNSCWN
jgi:hypothetical protein